MLGVTIKSFFEQCDITSQLKFVVDDCDCTLEDIMNLEDYKHYEVSMCTELRRLIKDLDEATLDELNISKLSLYPLIIIEIRRID